MKAKFIIIIFLALSATVSGQTVGIGSTSFTPNTSSVLELRTTTAGFLMPRMTEVQRDAIVSPAEGLLIYQNNNTRGFKYYDGTAWVPFGGSAGADNFGNHIATANIQLNDFWLSNDGGNDGIRIGNTGNVGIGTSTPIEKLQVAGKIVVDNDIYDESGDIRFSGDDDVYITMDYNNDDADTRAIRFGKNSMTAPTELMTISETGNVGIGTTTPDRLLNVGSATGPRILLTREDANTNTAEVLGELIFDSTDDTTPSTSDGSAVIRATASENQGNSNKGGNLSFLTKASGTTAATAATERMTILNDGNIGIGVAAPLARLHTNGSVRMDVLAGGGSQMVVTDNNGTLSTQALPTTGLWTQGAGSNIYRGTGYVGIGTSAPANKFEVVNSGSSGSADDISLRTYTATPGAQFLFQTARGTELSPTNIAANDDLGSIGYWGRIGGTNTQIGRIHMEYTGNGTTNESEIQITNSGYEHMRIDEIGRVCLGTGATTGVVAPMANFHLYGRGTSGFTPGGTTGQPSPGTGPEIGFGAGGFYNGLAASIQMIDYDGYSGGLAFNVHRGVYNGAGGTFADNWPSDVIQAMTIVNNGRVGIGTSDPSTTLEVNGDARITNLAGSGTRMVVADAEGDLSTQAIPSSGITASGVNGTSALSTSSGTYANVTGMSLVLTAGTYILQFNADVNATNSSTIGQVAIYEDGAINTGSERSIMPDNASAKTVTIISVITVSSAGTVYVQYRRSAGSGNFTMANRSFTAIRIS